MVSKCELYLSISPVVYSVPDQSELGLPQKSEGGFADENEDELPRSSVRMDYRTRMGSTYNFKYKRMRVDHRIRVKVDYCSIKRVNYCITKTTMCITTAK